MAFHGDRNETVDALRGLAAIAVCFFHFSNAIGPFASVSSLPPWTAYGRWGVDVFFVISGFIVPFAMARADYNIAIWHRFMARRLIRLEPPYLVSIAVVIAVGLAAAATPWFKGPIPEYNPLDVATHLGYLNAYLGKPWLNPVYWTLAIEFQYYVLAGLIFPVLMAGTRATRIGVVAVLACVPAMLPGMGGWFIASYLPIFSAGILTFLLVRGLISAPSYWVAISALAAYMLYAADGTPGIITAVAAIATALVLAYVRLPHIGAIAWLGTLSYSLYLLHVPISVKVINITARLGITQAIEVLAIALSFAASLVAAYMLYVLVEKPSQEAAKRISYAPDRSELRQQRSSSSWPGRSSQS